MNEVKVNRGMDMEMIKAAILVREKCKEQAKENISEVVKSKEFESFVKDLKTDEDGCLRNDSPQIMSFKTTELGKKITESLKDILDKEIATMKLMEGYTSKCLSEILDSEAVAFFLMIAEKVFTETDDSVLADTSIDKRDSFIEAFKDIMVELHKDMANKIMRAALRECSEELGGNPEGMSIH